MSRSTGLLAAAVVLAVGVLPGTIVAGALASGGTPSPVWPGDPQVDADPTPTPTPESTRTPTPTPQSTPTPLPDPTPTPSPVRETEAQVTALSIIDPDGDPTTLDDRHVFDGRWEFAGDFGSAEVLSADPDSEGNEPASWLIAYIVGAPIVVSDLLPGGYSLLDVECVGSDNSVVWSVDSTSVVGTFSGSMPVSLACLFVHSPAGSAPVGGSIDATKVIDPDGDPSTSGWEFPSHPFEFTIELDNADVVSEMPLSVDGDSAFWGITYTAPSTHVVITEVPQDGLELVRATCFDIWSDVRVPSTISGNSVSFEAAAPTGDLEGQYGCNFVNVRTGAAPRMTLPPTDLAGPTAGGYVDGTPLLLLLIGTSVGVLIVRGTRRTRWH
jgi:hypothetical protein